jgi:hypothetical protein
VKAYAYTTIIPEAISHIAARHLKSPANRNMWVKQTTITHLKLCTHLERSENHSTEQKNLIHTTKKRGVVLYPKKSLQIAANNFI